MLIWRTEHTSTPELQALLGHATGNTECLIRDDGCEAIVISEDGTPSEHITQISSNRVYSAGDCGPIAGPWIFLVGIWTPPEFGQELCDWYQNEHIPILMECKDWKGVDLRESQVASGRQFFVLHRLACKTALDSPERSASRCTDWFNSLAQNSWFDGPFERALYSRILDGSMGSNR